MQLTTSYYSMCQSISSQMLRSELRLPSRSTTLPKTSLKEKDKEPKSVYDAWLASRQIPGQKGAYLVAGAQRQVNLANARLAYCIIHSCAFDFFKVLLELNPVRTTLMMSLNVVRSLFPAFRGYSQALIVDELQSLMTSESFTWTRLLWLISTEFLRRLLEGLLDSFASANEHVVLGSAKFFVEYQQLEQRVRLDVPTLADPVVRDLLQESDLFAHSFGGGGLGLLSPLDFVHILSLTTEIISHIMLIISLTRCAAHFGMLFLSICSALLPFLVMWCRCTPRDMDAPYNVREARAANRQERMRNFAYSDVHRPEIVLFGLGDWILKSWSAAHNIVSTFEQPQNLQDSVFSRLNISDFTFALQNIPLFLIMQTTSTSLGSLTLYRSSVQSVVCAFGNLVTTTRMAFHGIFLMSAFCASMKLKPRLQPEDEEKVVYNSLPGGGMSLEIRGLSYTYPGSNNAALKDVNMSINAGESLAIVGYNGSGKSTLAKIILRIIDFDEGLLKVNEVDIRRYNPDDYHQHLTGVFQNFSKFNFSAKKNVGLGNVDKLESCHAIEKAIHLAEANAIIDSLPHGLRTILDTPGFESVSYPGMPNSSRHYGLSGGEWQRIALARAFMRASQPQVDLLLFDEPTSSLDAHAQNQIFDTIDKISKSPSDERIKSVIFITHRLSTARRADKIAMMEKGTISEFGTHQELIKKNGSYAALYRASV